jgi:predicted dehydrogenase
LLREESGALTDTSLAFLPNLNSYEEELRGFVKAVADDTPVPVSGEQGLMVTRILDGIYESAETGKEVRM